MSLYHIDSEGQIWKTVKSYDMFGRPTTTHVYVTRLREIISPNSFFMYLFYNHHVEERRKNAPQTPSPPGTPTDFSTGE
jgi:hypothetical protein